MRWRCVSSVNHYFGVSRWVVLVIALILAPSISHSKQAYLVTYGPGESSWEWFGHNAIWLEDPAQGLSHVYSFGYFSFEEEGFYWRFILGEMNYFGSSSLAEREMAYYRQANRSIRIQSLSLSAAQFDVLYEQLSQAIFPFPRYYAYDYFTANCSTWLRDILAEVYGEPFVLALQETDDTHTYRSLTQQAMIEQPMSSFGLSLLLGKAADRRLTQWEAAFLPNELANAIGTIEVNGKPIVLTDEVIFQGRINPESESDTSQLAGALSLSGLGLLFLMIIVWSKQANGRWHRPILMVALACLTLLGLVLGFMALLTSHEVSRSNFLMLVLHPFWLGLILTKPRTLIVFLWWLCLGSSVLAVFWGLGLWGAQDPFALWLFLPIAAGALWATYPARDISLKSSA